MIIFQMLQIEEKMSATARHKHLHKNTRKEHLQTKSEKNSEIMTPSHIVHTASPDLSTPLPFDVKIWRGAPTQRPLVQNRKIQLRASVRIDV